MLERGLTILVVFVLFALYSKAQEITENISGVSFKMIRIEGGSFEMGDTFREGDSDEKPIHTVVLDTYYLAETEVTQELWKVVMGSEPSELRFKDCPMCPVENVSWEDIVNEFLPKINRLTSAQYRLPTEAEWEYAARECGRAVRFGNGKDIADPREINFNGSANYKKHYSVEGVYKAKTTPVKSYAPNSLGLYDMSGNVWEWCSDWYGFFYYESGSIRNPQGTSSGKSRALRGGSWYGNYATDCRVTNRYKCYPSDRGHNIGFRLAVSP